MHLQISTGDTLTSLGILFSHFPLIIELHAKNPNSDYTRKAKAKTLDNTKGYLKTPLIQCFLLKNPNKKVVQ